MSGFAVVRAVGQRAGVLAGRVASSAESDSGRWTEPGITFAWNARASFARLGRAPEVAIVVDARLDDRAALQRTLGLNHAADDAALILAAYLQWGTACVARITGDFAFVIHDGRTGSLVAGRDPMGVRPLYVAVGREQIVFGNVLGDVASVPGVDTSVNPDRLRAYVLGEGEDRESTFYRGIRRIPPAHVAVFNGEALRLERYWTLENAPDVRLSNDEEYAAAFRELFVQAVADRVPAGQPVASTLSGGLDSSAVVCALRQVQGYRSERLHALSLVFPGLPQADLRRIDERGYVASVVRGGGLTAHEVRGDRISPLGHVDTIVDAVAEPFAAPNLYLHRAMYERAGQVGATAFFDGFDGDSVVGHGLDRLDALLADGRVDAFAREVRSFAQRRGISPGTVVQHHGLPFLRATARAGRVGLWARIARSLYRQFGVSRRDLLWQHGVRALAGEPRDAAAHRLLGIAPRRSADDGAAPGRDTHIAGLMRPVFQAMLELAAHTARTHGLVPVYPFFDRRLIEFCVGLPSEQKLHDGWTRYVQRNAMNGILPTEVQWRADKSNLSPAFGRGFREDDAERIRSIDFSSLQGHVDVAYMNRIRDGIWRDDQGATDPYLLFRMATLAVWMERRKHGPAVRNRARSAVETDRRLAVAVA